MYRVLKAFQDRLDELRGYQLNDWYPRFGYKPEEERIELLIEKGFIEEVDKQANEHETKDGELVRYPHHTGGGWYELSNGERVQGKKDAKKAEQSLKEGD